MKDKYLRRLIVAIKEECSDYAEDLQKCYYKSRGETKRALFNLICAYEETIKRQEKAA